MSGPLLVYGYLACSPLLSVVSNNSAAMNSGVQESAGVPALSSLGRVPRSGTAGSFGNSRFNFSKSHHIGPQGSHCPGSNLNKTVNPDSSFRLFWTHFTFLQSHNSSTDLFIFFYFDLFLFFAF